ncbi:MAG TPA: fibronectin type III domain-containing protein [Terriglobales bacterium]|jgi:hypothetical protein|nr:fibronectin type III domain-containing protein [Terriglobales bacterium]
MRIRIWPSSHVESSGESIEVKHGSYGSALFAYPKRGTRTIRRARTAIAEMTTTARVQESARRYLSALLLCALSSLLVACGSGGNDGGSGGRESVGSAVPTSTVPNTAVLSWDAVPVSNVDSYRVYYGTASGRYIQSYGHGLNIGNVTTQTVAGLSSGIRYYFVVTAVDTAGRESAFSNEVFKDVP